MLLMVTWVDDDKRMVVVRCVGGVGGGDGGDGGG